MAGLYHDQFGREVAKIQLLLINPNSTSTFTQDVARHLHPRLPNDVGITFYTPPPEAPASIDGPLDGISSTVVILKDLELQPKGQAVNAPEHSSGMSRLATGYSGIVVACFSAHPLVPVLKELLAGYDQPPPVLGILESSILAALQLGPTFGIATTGPQWEPLFDEAVRAMGISPTRYTGTKGTGFNAVSLHGDKAAEALLEASCFLVQKGAKVIILGCAGMAPMRASLQVQLADRVGQSVPVIDGVSSAVDMAIGYARMGIGRTFGPGANEHSAAT
ncbi:hypothetical protein I312_100382 [Cryptococcus bacillisporus CA1280]|uniref:Unplaced genomic scaffold supercont1.2, whole genome shotgun sequence n=2 Tax=Cryptococcus gattii TaxID=552467 RepID=A0A0D0TTD1_CRYGA|nr:hypothetical protein I312_00969 [Cryptococcus bacillisporus CA1280]KIR68529.1 hypothetical protein I314_00950 [Cryptococcus bacillisporus CA1873]|eukprot:KIR68529.1 hypothetical protein I314_00950 [Cryptococcus gattii CA1873]